MLFNLYMFSKSLKNTSKKQIYSDLIRSCTNVMYVICQASTKTMQNVNSKTKMQRSGTFSTMGNINKKLSQKNNHLGTIHSIISTPYASIAKHIILGVFIFCLWPFRRTKFV